MMHSVLQGMLPDVCALSASEPHIQEHKHASVYVQTGMAAEGLQYLLVQLLHDGKARNPQHSPVMRHPPQQCPAHQLRC